MMGYASTAGLSDPICGSLFELGPGGYNTSVLDLANAANITQTLMSSNQTASSLVSGLKVARAL